MSITASCFFFERMIDASHWDLCAGARERERSGSRWSARSDARTNDLEAGASPRRMIQVVNGDRAPSSTIEGSRLGARRLLEQARLLRHVFAEVHRHDGLRPRPGGLNHLAGFATAKVGALPDNEHAPGRVPSVTQRLGLRDSGSCRLADRSRRA